MSSYSGHTVKVSITEKPLSTSIGYLSFAFCVILHAALLACHAILVAVGCNGHPLHLVKNAWYTESFFYILNFGPNAVGKVRLTLSLVISSVILM